MNNIKRRKNHLNLFKYIEVDEKNTSFSESVVYKPGVIATFSFLMIKAWKVSNLLK